MRGLRAPFLEKWLARSDVARVEARSATRWLAAAFALAEPAPVAAIALAAEGEPAGGAWLRADPVHVRIDREKTSLHAAAVLEIERDEADALLETLQRHFASDGFEFRAPAPDRWYVRVPTGEVPDTMPLDEALGRNVQKVMPNGKGRIKWPSALTEIQMLFAAHEVNAARESAGRPIINSIWLWGGGERPGSLAVPYASMRADDAFARGLGTLSGARVRGSPTALRDLTATSAADWVLAMSDAPQRAIQRGSAPEWIEAVSGLDRAWFEGLGDTLANFGTVRIVLPSSTGTLVATLTGASRWRILRSRKPLATYA
jgi:hypothetical protein